ncbi:cytochrome c biogenesis CcdA family protein [Actinoplanes utahensis]|uniref:Cytochrome C biogenesis protein n=1 Tax=Actinoplanes utahensis TaxID=1869 RepID=A0A0A6UT42_ACTUT|nr:cytochrome c biogenesis protein CcdA [Actinoplanes utahensis]KHD78591.1 cytochrome C biogenesis protein [Actinoplanes utahensis]GIF31719.1 cytochrome C biogenesis protein CcdA [Actinoplanes utahensis]
MGDAFVGAVTDGPMLLAIGAALLAGLVSVLSPCVLPLLPGYLSYVTGLAGSDLEIGSGRAPVSTTTRTWAVRSRILAGTVLFVLGFTVVFTMMVLATTTFFTLYSHRRELNIALGVLIIVLGVGYLGWIPGFQRQARITRLPSAGLLGAPVFGAIFAVSWTPCVGPTLGGVIGLATTTGQADRAALLAVVFSLGLGIPFILFGLFFRRLLGVFTAIRRNSRWVTRIGGGLLIVVGLVLVTGAWDHFLVWLMTTFDFNQETLL